MNTLSTDFNIWRIAAGESNVREELWQLFKKEGYVAMGPWGEDSSVNYLDFNSQEELHNKFVELGKNENTTADKMVWDFIYNAKIGDVIVVNGGLNKILGIGVLSSEFIPQTECNFNNLGYNNVRKVDWIITESFTVKSSLARSTFTKVNNNDWNDILADYCRVNPYLIIEVFNYLHNSYVNSYYNTDKSHKNKYRVESEYINNLFDDILAETNDVVKADKFINKLLRRKSDVRVFSEESRGLSTLINRYSDESSKIKFTNNIVNVLDNLSKTTDYDEQKHILNEFLSSDYKFGFGTNRFTSILYYLNNNYYVINGKTKDAINFLGRFVDKSYRIRTDLDNYLDYLREYDKFLNYISEFIPEFGDFEYYDEFTHWLVDKNLGSFLGETANPLPYGLLNNVKDMTILKEDFEKILHDYPIEKEEVGTTESPIAYYIKKDFKDHFYDLVDTEKWYVNSNAGYGKLSEVPWLDFSRVDNWTGYDIAYLFKADMSGFYLTFRTVYHEGVNKEKEDSYTYLKNESDNIREFLKENNKINVFDQNIDLNAMGKLGKTHEICAVFAKYYDKNDVPNDNILIKDLLEFLEIYEFTIENYDSSKKYQFKEDNGVKQMKNDTKSFYTYLKNKNYFFDKEVVENYLLSLKVKPFVILTGNSGTGKTKLSQLFAEYLSEKNNSNITIEDNELYKIIPVGANWTENRHILGYQNIISGKYQSTPAYDLIKKSSEEENPYFLILDEMNLSHVERYFADFLSAIESEKPIPLYGKKESLEIPSNLFIVGTVNVDETTYMFSPKVLDRANTIEFETVSPSNYMSNNFDYGELEGNIKYLENPLSDLNSDLRNMPISQIKNEFENVKTDDGEDLWTSLSEEIGKFYKELKKANFDFGFRVIDEVVRFMYVAWKYENKPKNFDNWRRYFDAQIKQKMLPKLHGSEKVLKKPLNDLIKLCKIISETESSDEEGNPNIMKNEEVLYPNSLAKLEEMEDVLKKQRYVSFIN